MTERSHIVVKIGEHIGDVEKRLVLATLDHFKRDPLLRHTKVKQMAADALGISLKTLYNRLHEYGAMG